MIQAGGCKLYARVTAEEYTEVVEFDHYASDFIEIDHEFPYRLLWIIFPFSIYFFYQRLSPTTIFDHRCITRDELFAHTQLRAERSLGDDHPPVLPCNEQICQIA